MTQAELNRAVADATGESITTIAAHGFSILAAGPIEREPSIIDWDALDAERLAYLPQRSRTGRRPAC